MYLAYAQQDRKIFFIKVTQLWKCFGSQSKLAKQVTVEALVLV